MYNSIVFDGFDGKGLRTTKMDGEISLEFLTGFNRPLEIFCLPFCRPTWRQLHTRAGVCMHARTCTYPLAIERKRAKLWILRDSISLILLISLFFILSLFFFLFPF